MDSSVPQQDRSDELRSYPKDLLDSPSNDTGTRKMLKRFVASKVIHGHTHEHDHHHPHQHSQDHRTRAGGNLNLTCRSLAALGVVGGLVPSVSALVILIAAIWLHRVDFGLLLILAFSDAISVSIEPRGGSPQPTGDIVLLGNF